MVFVLVSTAAVTLLIIGLRTVRENADRVIASSIARGEVEALQAKGAEALTPGTTSRTVTQDGRAFTVSTSATWVSVDQTSDPCQAVIDPAALRTMRVSVSVAGGGLRGPQTLIALVPRNAETVTSGTGSVSVRVFDSYAGSGVPGVNVEIRNTGTNTSLGQYQTDSNGCLIVSGVAPGTGWQATISKPGYVALSPPGLTSTKAVTAAVNSAFDTFTYAPAASLTLGVANQAYPIPSGIPARLTTPTPLTQVPGISGLPTANSGFAYPLTITSLFPGTYQTWLGSCSDNEATGQSAVVAVPARTTDAPLAGARVQVIAAPGSTVSMTRNPFAGTCTGGLPTYPLGSTGNDWQLPVTVPYGDWTFATSGKESFGNIQLPTASGAVCSVYWGTGTETDAKTKAQQVATKANALRDDSNPAVTDAMLLSAALSIQGLDYATPSSGQLTVLKSLGAITANATVRISSGLAAADDTVALTKDGQPFTIAPPCNSNSPIKGSP